MKRIFTIALVILAVIALMLCFASCSKEEQTEVTTTTTTDVKIIGVAVIENSTLKTNSEIEFIIANDNSFVLPEDITTTCYLLITDITKNEKNIALQVEEAVYQQWMSKLYYNEDTTYFSTSAE